MYQTVLFDLDGTLTDPGEGITNSVVYALKKYGIHISDRTKLYKFIGPPLQESFEIFYGFPEEKAREAVAYNRKHYSKTGIFENKVYDGMEDALKKLKASGKKLVVATAKPELFANQILEHFHLSEYFSFVAGANMDGTRTKKDEVIAFALESCQITDCSNVVMVGDREHDVFGAAKFGIDAIGVLYGYGTKEELEGAGAAYLVETPGDICKVVL